MAKIAKTHEGKRSFPCYVGSPLPNLLRLWLPRFLPLPVVPFLGARARSSGPASSARRQRRRPLPRVMASYSYTPDRRFVQCSGAAASALFFFSDPGASLNGSLRKILGQGSGEERVGTKSSSPLGTAVGIVCAWESHESTEIRQPLSGQPSVEFSQTEAHYS